jgi:hypothetical protein
VIPDAFTVSSSCSGRDAPTSAAATFGFASTHAMAICGIEKPGLCRNRLEALHGLQGL